MRRGIVLGILVMVGGLSVAAAALQQPPPAPHVDNINVEKVKDNLYVLRGGGGNTAAFITATGVVVVDTKNPGWGQPLLDKLKTLTDKPVTTIINTHTHYDHVSGNVDFPPDVEIVTQENTRALMTEMKDVYGMGGPQPNVFKDKAGRGMPKRTFKDRMTIGKGPDQIDLHYVGRAHTGGDAFIVFRAHRIMHAGDTFPNKSLPIMDANNGGSGVDYPNTLTKASRIDDVDTIINGHTPTQTTSADLKEYAEFVREFVTTVQTAKKNGQTVDDVVKTWKTPAKYTGYPAANPDRVRADAQVIWNETK